MTTDLTFHVPEAGGAVSALLSRSAGARVLYVLGHGAGAGMRHPFLTRIVDLLVDRGVATLRYQFPYMECGKRRPDSHRVLHGTVRAAVAAAAEAMPDVPLLAGGKSMGGRMTSLVQAAEPLPGVVGLVFLGFPLHAPKKPTTDRAGHLADVNVPMLFLQGTRDSLADLTLLGPVIDALGSRATMHVVEGGDHSFKVLKRSGRTEDEVFDELADTIATWAAEAS